MAATIMSQAQQDGVVGVALQLLHHGGIKATAAVNDDRTMTIVVQPFDEDSAPTQSPVYSTTAGTSTPKSKQAKAKRKKKRR